MTNGASKQSEFTSAHSADELTEFAGDVHDDLLGDVCSGSTEVIFGAESECATGDVCTFSFVQGCLESFLLRVHTSNGNGAARQYLEAVAHRNSEDDFETVLHVVDVLEDGSERTVSSMLTPVLPVNTGDAVVLFVENSLSDEDYRVFTYGREASARGDSRRGRLGSGVLSVIIFISQLRA